MADLDPYRALARRLIDALPKPAPPLDLRAVALSHPFVRLARIATRDVGTLPRMAGTMYDYACDVGGDRREVAMLLLGGAETCDVIHVSTGDRSRVWIDVDRLVRAVRQTHPRSIVTIAHTHMIDERPSGDDDDITAAIRRALRPVKLTDHLVLCGATERFYSYEENRRGRMNFDTAMAAEDD